jgi:hypothetical protein
MSCTHDRAIVASTHDVHTREGGAMLPCKTA